MRSYIVAKSSYIFQSSYFGDDSLNKVIQTQIQDTWQQLMEFELENNDYSILNNEVVKELLSR